MNFRLVRPDLVVDISRLRELHGVEQTNKTVRIGAGVTHAMIEDGIVEGKTGLYLREVAGGPFVIVARSVEALLMQILRRTGLPHLPQWGLDLR